MADITQNINYNYKTNVQTLTRYHDQYNASLGRVQRTTQRLTRTIGSKDKQALVSERITYRNAKATGKLSGAFSNLGGSMGGLALRFVGYNMVLNQVMGAQQKLVQWVTESIGKFREFQKSMAEVSTIIGDLTKGQMPGLTAGVESLSVRFGKSATDMARGLYDILSAAFDANDAIRLLTTATKASIAGLADVSTSVDIFTSVLNAYGMTVSQAQHISDVFFQTIRRGKLVFEDLASALGYVTPIASAAGVAFDEIAAILATVTRMGLHVDMASRGLALTIQSIVSPTQQAADAARKYDVDMSGLALRVKGLTGFMKDLNTAVDEHGATILPEMIRNMRSLRVVMAVTSDEGIAGMTEDLGYMKTAAGQTEFAMTKMTAISQMQVDILANSMEHLERRVGEAWSGVDIWWKKTQLWWGTLLSGGDANKAIQDFEDRVSGLNSAYLAMFKTQEALAGKGTLLSELLSPDVKGVSTKELVDSIIPWDEINQYMQLESEKRLKGASMADLLLRKIELEEQMAKPATSSADYKTWELPDGTLGTYDDLRQALKAVNDEIAQGNLELMEYQSQQESLQPAFDYMSAGLDDLSQSMSAHQTNIIELENAMKSLRHEVETTYTAMSGQTFAGRLEWQIETKESEVFFDRFNQFSAMAIKYGDDFSAIEWFDKDIWDMINGVENYDGSMQDIIDTLHSYSKASENAAKLTNEFKQEQDELAKAIRRNNLEIMKIQLKGMMRRRGQTRSEQRTIKKIEIENAKIRINQMENTIELEETIENEHIDELKLQYDKAKAILDEYTNRAKFNLYLLKDIRDDELRDMEELYTGKHSLLSKYTTWQSEENTALLNENEAYVEVLQSIASRPETAEMYRELYGINASQEAIAALERLRTFQASRKAKAAPTTYAKKESAALSFVSKLRERVESSTGKTHNPLLQLETNLRRRGFKRGTYDVPEDALVNVHKHEKIVPAGDSTKAGGGSIVIQNLTIDVKEIAEINDIEKLGALLSAAQNSKVLNRSGRTKFRSR